LIVVLNKNIKLIVNYVAGPVIMFLLFYTVAGQLQKQPHWKDSLQQMLEAAIGKQQWKLYCMFGLMWVNWALETRKWQIALRPVQPIGFFRAFKAILAGTCIASFTPNRVGEYLGRMLFVDPGNKILSVTPTILCSLSQMLITLVAGSIGLYLFSLLSFQFQVSWLTPGFFRIAMMGTAVAAVILGLVYFRFDPLVRRINDWLKKNQKSFSIPQDFSFSALTTILVISTVRYMVFILQYFLLFSLFGIPLMGKQVFTGVSVMFVLMAVVPTLTFLTDLGFRWAAGIQIFQVFTFNTAGILAVSLGIWLINLIIPALIGSLLILRIKLFSSR
jgi:Lysylphosphatidylglycerol synthase TM region